jgi:PHP family Zn ribbon phosphoesterase/transcriptional regulator with XRE-family HTH domain
MLLSLAKEAIGNLENNAAEKIRPIELKGGEVIADLHIHSRYSRATSKNLDIDNLAKWAKIKGINLLGTGDISHEKWLSEIREKLVEKNGILWYKLNDDKEKFPFILSGEISLVFTLGGKGRRVHLVYLVPSLDVNAKINKYLDSKGRRDYDGRPIFSISCEEFARVLMDIDSRIEIIPAHCMTPWFGVFGSESGFDSLREAFGNQYENIHAVESGMSADPAMLWKLKFLEDKAIVSFSDSHCVHPETFITLRNGYVLPIMEVAQRKDFFSAKFNDFSIKSLPKIQFSRVKSPEYLTKICFASGEIIVSDKHRFFVLEKNKLIEKYSFELKRGDKFIRAFNYPHKESNRVLFQNPPIKEFFKLTLEGITFLKNKRIKNNLFQKDIAKILKLNPNHYYKIEKGLAKIRKNDLLLLSNILKFDYNAFVIRFTKKEDLVPIFPKTSNIELLELLGYFIGDGCYTKINRGRCLILSDKNEEILRYYQKIVSRLFNCNSRLFKCTSKNSYGLLLPSAVAQFFKLNFPEATLKSKLRRIPELIYSCSLGEISGFLRGIFDAEGCFGNHNVDFCSSNKLLLYQVDALLKKFGICTSIYLNQLEKIKNKKRHRLFIFGEYLKLFYKEINFNHNIKKKKIADYLSNLTVNRKSKIEKIGDFVLSEIKGIRTIKSDTSYLYDLAIFSTKNYLANEIVVHNSFWPWRMGREATIFSLKQGEELSYELIINQIRNKSFVSTIETDPGYGKYHYDGHRNCGFSCSPAKTKELNGICPVCKKELIIGVENRVEALSNNKEIPKNAKHFFKILPLHELIAFYLKTKVESKKTWQIYDKLIAKYGNEINILLRVDRNVLFNDLAKDKLEGLAQLIIDNRIANLHVQPGYDGTYGVLIDKNEKKESQTKLV